MAATKQLGPRGQRIVAGIGFSFIVLAGLALAILGTGLADRVAGCTLLVGLLAAVGGLRAPKRDIGELERTETGVRVPRRLAYPAWLAVTNLALAVSMLSMGAAAINDEDYRGGFRGSAEILVVLFPPLLVVGLLFVAGGLVRRGSLELTPEHVQFTPVVGRRKTCRWEQITSITARPGDALVVTAPRVRMVVGHHTQRWTPAGMADLVRRFSATDEAGRAALVADV